MDNRVLILDTIWCRLLCTMERLEIVEGLETSRTTECHDLKHETPPSDDDRSDLISEFELQKKAFMVALKPISDELPRYIADFCGWCADLEGENSSLLDGLALKLGLELLGEGGFEVQLPPSEETPKENQLPSSQGGSLGGDIGMQSENDDHSHARGLRNVGVGYLTRLDQRFSKLADENPEKDGHGVV